MRSASAERGFGSALKRKPTAATRSRTAPVVASRRGGDGVSGAVPFPVRTGVISDAIRGGETESCCTAARATASGTGVAAGERNRSGGTRVSIPLSAGSFASSGESTS